MIHKTYSPTYDTTIRTSTKIERHNTMHTLKIDWIGYPFDDWIATCGRCCDDSAKREHLEKLKEWLRLCETCDRQTVYASNYGGIPRIWHRVLQVGMGSAWPYWTPRPCVIVEGTLGSEWYDWAELTGVHVDDASPNGISNHYGNDMGDSTMPRGPETSEDSAETSDTDIDRR